MTSTRDLEIQITDIDFDWSAYNFPPDYWYVNDLIHKKFIVKDDGRPRDLSGFKMNVLEQVQDQLDLGWPISEFEFVIRNP